MSHNIITGNGASDVSLVPLYIQAGGSGTVVAVATGGATLNVHQNGRHNSQTDTVTAGNSKTYTVGPVWISQPNGNSQLTITGPGYPVS